MGSYVLRRHIMAPPAEVFRAFTDPDLVVDWMDAKAIVLPSGQLDQAGTQFKLVIFGIHSFRSTVVRSEAGRIHETSGSGRFGRYHMVATLTARGGGTDLELLTEYGLPLGPLGRWIDRRWIDREPRAQANREIDRLVELVSRKPVGSSADAGGAPAPA